MSKVDHCLSTVNRPQSPPSVVLDDATSLQKAQTRITCASTVANCLDTLKITFWVDWLDSKVLEQLEDAKQVAQSSVFDSEPIELSGHTFNCHRTGTKLFKYRLVKGDVRLLFSPRNPDSDFPNTRLEIGSMSCWSPGYMRIYSEFIKFVELLGGVVNKERISEAHLCADFIGLPINDVPVRNEDHWITLAHNFNYRSNRRKFSYISWGSGDFMLRIYDKALELENNHHKKELFMDVWGLDSLVDNSVTRVEYQIRRPIFNSFSPKIVTVEDLINSLKVLWDYCTNDWSRLADSPVDRNHHQARAKTDTWWEQVQAVKWKGDKSVERKKEYAAKDFIRLGKQLAGVGMSLAAQAVKNPDDIDGVVYYAQGNLENVIRSMAENKPIDFSKKMSRKINEARNAFSDHDY